MKITNADIERFIPEGTQAGKFNPIAIVYSRMDMSIAILEAMKDMKQRILSHNNPMQPTPKASG